MDIRRDRRDRAIETLLREAVLYAVQEKLVEQEQQAQADVHPQEPQGPAVPGQPAAGQQEGQPTEEPVESVDSLIEKLNVIRGGSSFKDPEVYGQLTTWYNKLTEEQKSALNDQLNIIGKVVSIAEPEEATTQDQQNQQQQQQQPTQTQPQPAQTQPAAQQQTQTPITPQ